MITPEALAEVKTDTPQAITDAAIISCLKSAKDFKQFVSLTVRALMRHYKCEYRFALKMLQDVLSPLIHREFQNNHDALASAPWCLRHVIYEHGFPMSLAFIYDKSVWLMMSDKYFNRPAAESLISASLLEIVEQHYQK